MEPWQRTRSQTLAKWMGARCAQDVAGGTELLVAARASWTAHHSATWIKVVEASANIVQT